MFDGLWDQIKEYAVRYRGWLIAVGVALVAGVILGATCFR